MFNDYDFYFNIALIGSSSVGKTSILCRYIDGVLDYKAKTTVGYDFRIN
jgi:Ras-related protein Rab-18